MKQLSTTTSLSSISDIGDLPATVSDYCMLVIHYNKTQQRQKKLHSGQLLPQSHEFTHSQNTHSWSSHIIQILSLVFILITYVRKCWLTNTFTSQMPHSFSVLDISPTFYNLFLFLLLTYDWAEWWSSGRRWSSCPLSKIRLCRLVFGRSAPLLTQCYWRPSGSSEAARGNPY